MMSLPLPPLIESEPDVPVSVSLFPVPLIRISTSPVELVRGTNLKALGYGARAECPQTWAEHAPAQVPGWFTF